jgi:hypothetical protein
MFNPFGMGSARQGFGQQGSNQPYDFKGLESRLGKIETGIAGLTEQFGNFQMPGQETVDPEYTGNAAPDPLTTAAPTGGIQSLPEATPMGGLGGQGGLGLQPGIQDNMNVNPPSFGGGQALRQMMMDPSKGWGGANYTPLTEEQFNTQSGQWGKHLDYRDFSDMAAGMTGVGDAGRRKMGADPRFGHAYDAWQGADQSQGMENWMQDYNFDLAPTRPEWQPNVDWQTSMANQQSYLDSPEYTDWQQRQEELGPVSATTSEAMRGGRHGGTLGLNSISPYIRNEGLFGAAYGRPEGQTPTYENYLSDIQTSQQQAQELANLKPQIAGQPSTAIQRPNPEWLAGLGSLQGPTQQKIKQGYNV